MEENKLIDGADYITLEDAKRLKLPYFEVLAKLRNFLNITSFFVSFWI